MDTNKKIEVVQKLLQSSHNPYGLWTSALEFFRVYVGEDSLFFKQLHNITHTHADDHVRACSKQTLEGYISYLKAGLETGMSLERRIQLDTVSDLLEQATLMLNDSSLHPAASCVIIGAALEEFLRNWCEDLRLVLINKASIDTYSKALKENGTITKQDMKDITGWAGLRNSAAHGHWDDVSDRKKIELMLHGVNWFMRQASESQSSHKSVNQA